MTLNPDLVFDSGQSVGDIKYKLPGTDWSRPDLYQLVAFATGFWAKKGVLVHFARDRDEGLPTVRVGDVQLHAAYWLARDEIGPEQALSELVVALRAALS